MSKDDLPISVLPEPPVAARHRRPLFLALVAAVTAAIVALSHEVLTPFVLALVIAYVLTPLVSAVERRRVPRGLAIVVVYASVLGSLWLFARITAPRVLHELRQFRAEVPSLVEDFKTRWVPSVQSRMQDMGIATPAPPPPTPEEEQPAVLVTPRGDGGYAIEIGSGFNVAPTERGYLVEPSGGGARDREVPLDPHRLFAEAAQHSLTYARGHALEMVKLGGDIVAAVSRLFFVFGITLMLAAYMMLTRERILEFFASLVRPSSRPSFDALLERVDRGLSGVVRGQLIICGVNGALSAIGFAIVGLKYWPVLALIATVFSLVPIFGSIISSVPAVALGLTQGLGTATFVLMWIVGIHQLEANLLNPKIMGDAAKIHPLLVVFALLVGEHFFHIAGALLAVPVMSIAQSLFIHFRQIVHESDPELQFEPASRSLPPPRPRP